MKTPQAVSQSPARLTVPVHFFCPANAIWPELVNPDSLPVPPDVVAQRAGSSISAWVVQVYHWMKSTGEDVSISDTLKPDAINITHIRSFGRKDRLSRAYVLVARADGHDPKLANFTVHQNNQYQKRPRHAYMPHWPQPGIKPRSPDRGHALKRLSYMGTPQNLAPEFQSDDFRTALAQLGVTLDLRFSRGDLDCTAWSDYSQTDAVLAVRGRAPYLESLKPASKLVNAWTAGVPAILGPEPAFQELRTDALDYFEAPTAQDALDAIGQLCARPDLYAAMCDHGFARAQDYSEDRIGGRWIDLLNGDVAADFQRWLARSAASKWAFVGAGIAGENASKRAHVAQMRAPTP